MMAIGKVALSGLGAVGGMCAEMIHSHDSSCLSVVVDRERKARYEKTGVVINDRACVFNYADPEHGSPADLVIFAVKQHHLEQATDEMNRFIDEDTIILSLLNGISSEEIIMNKVKRGRILRAFVVGTDSVRIGTGIRYSKTGEIVFGAPLDDQDREKVESVKEFLGRTRIPFRVPDDILREQWWKFMMNVGINQVSAVLGAPYGVFQDIPEARELMESASREAIAIARKAGIDLSEDDIARYVKILFTLSPDGKTSMLQDVEAKRKTEVEIFSGTLIGLGAKYGVETPVNNALYRMIRTFEKRYGAI